MIGCCAVDAFNPEGASHPSFEAAFDWKGGIPIRTPGKKDKPLR
jgi:hypothetical protein